MTASPLSAAEHTRLVICLHAFTATPDKMSHVKAVVMAEKPRAHVLVPALPVTLFSMANPVRIALDIVDEIDRQVQFRATKGWPPFEEILLVGHSFGALLARKVFLLASGETNLARFEHTGEGPLEQRKPWADSISRIILLAGMNGGWSVTHHLSFRKAVFLSACSAFGNLVLNLFHRQFVIFQIRRGATFITELRLQWLALTQQAKPVTMPMTIQLLGTIDDLVSPEDNIDLVTGRDFFYLDVPRTGHANVVDMDDSPAGRERRRVFSLALAGDPDEIRRHSILPADPVLAQIRPDVTNVVFVVHGIRDAGFWTQKIARKVQSLGNVPPRMYASETATYGYFPMVPFLLPSHRRQKVQWLMDQFVEAKSLYPNAEFSYVGHSNGTYLLADALQTYRACRFEKVVFAGSVVRRDYDWRRVIQNGQVGAVLNYVATADWVVAWFPGALEMLGLQDLGTAGHNGFDQAAYALAGAEDLPVFERRYVPGKHSAALVEENWDDIANFVVKGRPVDPGPLPLAPEQNRAIRLLGSVAPALWLIILAIILGIALLIIELSWAQWARTLTIVVYFFVVWKILTKL